MLSKDIRNTTDAELSAAIRTLIEDREPESLRLDYKETLDIRKDTGKKELAKDVSSFANEQGGILIYGVPEVRDGELPRPKPLAECGMEIAPGLVESIERILISTVQPPLHALTIRVVDLPEIAPKQLLVIQHPESYWKPHMIEGYGVRRYYRRGNFQAVIMNEREVEAAYLGRESARNHAREFFGAASFGSHTGIVVRAVACPVMPGRFKEKLLHPGILSWLNENRPVPFDLPFDGNWLPFLDGWRFLGASRPEGVISGNLYELRIFHNGAVCLNLDAMNTCVFSECLALDELRKKLEDLFLRNSGRIFTSLGIDSAIIIKIKIPAADCLGCAKDSGDLDRMERAKEKIECGKSTYFDGRLCGSVDELIRRDSEREEIEFEEETSVDEIVNHTGAVADRLMTRVSTAFGLWGV